MKILIIDNYDSFTWNLYHYAEQFCDKAEVARNDEITVEEVGAFDKIIISPGPGLPKDAGITPQLIETYHASKPILGVCLGLQAIYKFFGGELYNMPMVLHGKSTICKVVEDDYLFEDIPEEFQVGRYHSWSADKLKLPADIIITAIDSNDVVLALKHEKYDLRGVQFHPESIMTHYGLKMIGNWVDH